SGRSVGVRFSTPLDDETEYTVRVADVTTVGGGPAATLETSFTTPASQVYLLQRAVEGDDTIFLSDLTGQAAPVFTHPRINDFRATADRLVVAVEDDEGNSQILAMNPDGTDARALP